MERAEKIWNRKFILLFITNLLVLAAFYASIPIIPVYCAEIGITGSQVGIVLTAMSVATVLFRPVAGYPGCFAPKQCRALSESRICWTASCFLPYSPLL